MRRSPLSTSCDSAIGIAARPPACWALAAPRYGSGSSSMAWSPLRSQAFLTNSEAKGGANCSYEQVWRKVNVLCGNAVFTRPGRNKAPKRTSIIITELNGCQPMVCGICAIIGRGNPDYGPIVAQCYCGAEFSPPVTGPLARRYWAGHLLYKVTADSLWIGGFFLRGPTQTPPRGPETVNPGAVCRQPIPKV